MADTTNVGEIAVEILARTERLEKGLAKAAHGVQAFSGVVAGVAAGVTEFFLHMGERAVEGVVGMVEHTLESVHALEQLSNRVQASISDIQALGVVAARTGSSAETLQNGMEKFVKILGGAEESATGGSAAKAIAMLGLNMKDLQLNDKAEGMAVIASRLDKISNVTQRAYIETSLFGKTGQQLDGTLRTLAATGLDGVVKGAMATGQALNEIDNQKIVMASESVHQLHGIFAGLANLITAQLAPVISYITDQIVDFIKINGGLGPVVSQAFSYINNAIGWVINSMHLLQAGWFGFQAVVNTVADVVIGGPLQAIALYIDTIFVQFQNGINVIIGGYNKLQNLAASAQAAYAESQKEAAKNRGDKEGVSYYSNLQRLAESDMNKNAIKPISVVDTGLSDFAAKFRDELQKSSAEGAKGYSDHMEAWLNGKGHDAWMEFTDSIATDFTKKAAMRADEAAAARKNSGLVETPGGKAEQVKTGFGLQLDTSRVSVDALRMAEKKVQKVEDPQLAETNGLLGKLVKVGMGSGKARTSK